MSIRKVTNDVWKYVTGHQEYIVTNKKGQCIYPVDLDFTLDNEKFFYFPKDDKGVPQKQYHSVGIHYNPTRIAAYGLAHWNRYQENKTDTNKNEFSKSLQWFMDHQENGTWNYYFNWGNLQKPWISCMAQGEGISILTRGFLLYSKEQYLTAAFKALHSFTESVEHGGVLSYLSDECLFFEEYPEKDSTHVLNGFLYALIGLLELDQAVDRNHPNKSMLQSMIADSISSLEKNIHRWDCGYWSCYDLDNEEGENRNLCTISYHSLHVTQLKYIGEITNSEILMAYSTKWNSYIKSRRNRLKALYGKSIYRLKNPAQR